MKRSNIIAGAALGALLFGALRVANSAPLAPRVEHARSQSASPLKVLYDFGSIKGYFPVGDLIFSDGLIYGTAADGGSSAGGMVFSLTPAGVLNILYTFGGVPDGSNPWAGITLMDGTIYGTTLAGGRYGAGNRDGCGTVFALSSPGTEHVVSRFGCAPHLESPYGKLLKHSGVLYGTTYAGGADDAGTVFSITKSGQTTILHDFDPSLGDGSNPQAGLTELNGTLYGTTDKGGTSGDGTVYAVSVTGTETVIHTFSGTDGAMPVASLIAVDGTLYGTTSNGGRFRRGTVYSITPSGTFTVLHDFAGGATDGALPQGQLTAYGGALYGTTKAGGIDDAGTIFRLGGGTETILHSFGSNGMYPYGGMVAVNGALYGTTGAGGTSDQGTIFRFQL